LINFFTVKKNYNLLLLGITLLCLKVEAKENDKPNIILISIDTVSAEHLQSYGYKFQTTPFIDSWAKDAIFFQNAFSQAAYTYPSHYSIFTGVVPQTHHMIKARAENAKSLNVLHPDFLTIAQYMKSAGYHTAWYGPLNDRQLDLESGIERGFDEIKSPLIEGLPYTSEKLKSAIQIAKHGPTFFFFHTYIAHTPYKPIPPFDKKFGAESPKKKIQTMEEVDAANIEFGTQKALDKWYSQFNLGNVQDREKLRVLYDGGLRTLDLRLKNFMDILKKEGLYKNSIIILTSDHGEEFGKNDVFFHVTPFRSTLHVPLIIKAPGYSPRKVPDSVQGIDILPTILDLAGIVGKSNIEGESLLPFVEGKQKSRKNVRHLSVGLMSEAISDESWRLVSRFNRDKFLYNFKSDPNENDNLLEKFPAEAARLQTELDAFKVSRISTFKPRSAENTK
jgi:arylsulfatase A-like enzyme